MAMILKITCEKDVHRVALPEDNVTYEAVQQAVKTVHPEGTMVAKYMDEEGDMCTLAPMSFSDFLACGVDVNGRRVFKLEVTPLQVSDCRSSPQIDSQLSANMMDVDLECSQNLGPETPFQVGRGRFGEQLPWNATNGSGPWWLGGSWRRSASWHTHTVQGMFFKLVQLRKNGYLDVQSAVALVIAHLPALIETTASHAGLLDSIVAANANYLRPILEDLQALSEESAHMQRCAWDLEDFLSGKQNCASVVFLSFLTSLDLLPFTEKVRFLEAVYTRQGARLQQLFALAEKWNTWLPTIPLHHVGVTCDGCHSSIRGLRFKCGACVDFDLCSTCFTTRSADHCNEFTGHQFDLIEWPSPWEALGAKATGKGWRIGKGMGKCKASFAKGKGKAAFAKGKGKGKFGKGEVLGELDEHDHGVCQASFGPMWQPIWHSAKYAKP